MHKISSVILIILHITLVLPIDEVFAAEYRLKAFTITSGKKIETAQYKLKQAAIGEPFGGRASNSSYKVSFGYIPSTALNYPRLKSNIPDGFTSIDLYDYFEDPCERELTFYVIENNHINVTINGSLVTWSPHPSDFVGSEEVFFVAENIENAKTKSNSVILTAKDPSGGNNAPKLRHIEDIEANEGELVSLYASAYDADNDTLTYTYSSLFDATGRWQTDYEDAGDYAVTVTVSDGKGESDSQVVNVTILNKNQAPVINSVNGVSVINENVTLAAKDEGNTVKLDPAASDPDGEAVTITYEAPFDSDGSWQIPYDFTGSEASKPVKTKITATDGTDSSSVYVTITINNVNVSPLVNLSLNPASIKEGNNFTVTIDASDLDGDAITLTLKKIEGSNVEILEDSISITSIYERQFSILDEGTYTIEATVKEVATQDQYETTASAYLEVTSESQNEDAIKPVSGDFNGDGLTDIGYLDTDDDNESWHISLSDNGNFNGSAQWPTNFDATSKAFPLTGEFNGDGFADIVYYNSSSGLFSVKLSKGNSFNENTIDVPSGAVNAHYIGLDPNNNPEEIVIRHIPFTGDFNGDGLTDIGYYHHATSRRYLDSTVWRQYSAGEKYVAYSTENGFDDFVNLSGPEIRYGIPIATDFNGDGIADFCLKCAGVWHIMISDGNGPTSNVIQVTDFGSSEDPAIGDFNLDGLTDIGYYNKDEGKIYYRAFKGDAFEDTNRVYLEGLKTSSEVDSEDDLSATVGDYNGDSILDAATFVKTTDVTGMNKWSITLHQSQLPDLLTEFSNGIDGKTQIAYAPSTALDNKGTSTRGDGNPDTEDLPFPVRVVKKVTKTDGMGHSYETNYEYKYGYFETDSREFRGFGWVRQVDSEGHFKITEFNQDDIYKGKPDIEVVYDKYSRKIQETDYGWDYIQYHDAKTTFPYLDIKTTTLCDYKTQESKDIQTSYSYDEYGNVIKIRNEGFIGAGEEGDERETNITYYYDVAKWIVSKPELSVTSGSPEVKTEYEYYDNGSLKKEKRWLDTESKWIETTYTYYPEGNLHTTTDALSRTTTTTYESTKTFPQSVENALGHTQSFTYDYATGKIKTSTDPNGVITTSTYDGFGRLLRVEDSGGISYVIYEYAPNGARPQWVKTTTKVGGGLTDSVAYSYIDGLGRTIRNVIEVDDGKKIVSDIVEYDSRGQVIKKYLPYYESEGMDTATQYEYDPLGRVVMTIRPDGKVSQNIYSITTQETINEKAQRNKVTKDAYGRIVTVEEANGNQMHYEYDTLGNLTKVTDCQNNVTTMTYDSLGRKTSMVEPNMGRWEYVYNDVGNLETQTDNKNQTITFDYDKINRLISKSTGVAYIYKDDLKAGDTPLPNGIGRLDKVTYPNGEATFEYDELGREKISTKVIDGVSYTVQREYDSLDRLTKVVYPYGQVVKYKYNKQGGIDLVGADTDEDYFVRETRYDEYGHLEYIEYGNGSKTEYTFDDLTLRLTHLKTWDKNGEVIQDLDYDFDNIGNINSITDSIHASNTQNFGYDTLNRLTHATAGSGGYGSISYNYDDIGNITQKDNLEFIYPNPGSSLPHAVQEVKKNGQTLYNITYDDNGNMLTKGDDSAYEWDIENRLEKVSISTGGKPISVDIQLQSGWNFMSLPFRQVEIDGDYKLIEKATIQEVLQSIEGKYDQVSKHDTQAGAWKHFVNDPEFINDSKFDHSKITNFEYGEGYLIYIKDDVTSCNLTLSGITNASEQSGQLYAGYNLVGAMTDDTISVSDQFGELNITSAKSYDGSVYVDVSVLEKGKAYWVYLDTDSTWTIQIATEETLYQYDGDGGRVERTFEDRTTIYIGSSYEITIDNTTGDVLKSKKNVFMGSSRVCEVEQNFGIDEIHAYFVHADHIGSSNILTDESGSRVSLFEYKPFGSVAYAAEDNSYDTDKRFTGKTYDDSSGLHYYGARYYDSELGRFITADTVVPYVFDPQSFNRYSYVRNNPLVFTDPSGNKFQWWNPFSWFGGGGGAIAAVATMFVTAMAMIFTGGTASPFLPALNGMFFGALGGGAAAAITGGDIGSGMFGGTVMGGITGGMLGPVGSPSTTFMETTAPGMADLGRTFALTYSGPSMAEVVTSVAYQSIATSGVGAGVSVLNNTILLSTGAHLGKNTAESYLNSRPADNGVRINYGYSGVHTGYEITGTGMYDGRWGFNPDFENPSFSWQRTLSKQNVPGKVYTINTGEKPYLIKIPISNNLDDAAKLYNSIQVDLSKNNLTYNLDCRNCYHWRNRKHIELKRIQELK